jgi:hypothetical protein
MQEKNYYKQIALNACVYYTVTTFLLSFIYWALNTDSITQGFNLVALVLVFPFALCFSSANTLYRYTNMKKGWRLLFHFVLTVGGAFLFLYLPNKAPDQGSFGAVVILMLFSLLYWLVMGTVLIVSARTRRVQREAASYTGVYRKK